jgi:hypothetical protein
MKKRKPHPKEKRKPDHKRDLMSSFIKKTTASVTHMLREFQYQLYGIENLP